MIWRDDDISATTDLRKLQAADDLFQQYQIPHTLAVIAEMIDVNRPLVELILERRMIVELHGWSHDDLTKSSVARGNLHNAVLLLKRTFNRRPLMLYPPWNRSDDVVEKAAEAIGLTVSIKKISLEQYIRSAGDVAEDTVNFHYWHDPDVALLPEALQIARRKL